MNKMKVLSKKYSKEGLWLDEKDLPQISSDEVLVKVKKTAICGTDLHIYNWDSWSQENVAAPRVLGHEFSGVVEAVGSHVKSVSPGDRVSAEGHLVCGNCRSCQAGQRHLCPNTLGLGVHTDGAFAEFVKIPESNIYKLPKSISDDEAAIFDPFGNAVYSTSLTSVAGEDVLITGAGPVGCMTALLCRHLGARHTVVTDVNDYRLNLIKGKERLYPVNIKKKNLENVFSMLNMKEGFDVCFEMSGNPSALQDIIKYTRHGAQVINLGLFPSAIEINLNEVILKSLTLRGVYGREIFESWYKMVSYIESGFDIKPLVTHHFPFEDYQEAFNLLNQGSGCKVILEWS